MNFIFIEALRLEARVGIYSRERVVPQTVEIDLSFALPEAAAMRDNIADTVDYAAAIKCISAEVATRHFNLIEALGEFIADLLCERFAVEWAEIRLAKLGVMRGVRRVGVCIRREKAK